MFICDPNGVVKLVTQHDAREAASRPSSANKSGRQQQRVETARRTDTLDGFEAFIKEYGVEEAARRMHDASFGCNAEHETPDDTHAGKLARDWSK